MTLFELFLIDCGALFLFCGEGEFTDEALFGARNACGRHFVVALASDESTRTGAANWALIAQEER